MKLVLKLTDGADKTTTKTFENLADDVTDGKLKDIARKYQSLTDAVSNVPSKVVTTVLDLS